MSRARPILDGLGNVDERAADRACGRLEGFTLRLFNPLTWETNWTMDPARAGGAA